MNKIFKNKDFGLKNSQACITGLRLKDKYMEYQDEYRKEYGVFPELDQINHPFTARWDDVYNSFYELRRCSFIDALWYHDLCNRFRKKLKHFYKEYSDRWSFFISIGLDYRNTFHTIINMEPDEHIVNELGYRKDENGNYFEGTWKNDQLIYGLIYLAEQNIFYVGSFDESGKSNCNGIRFTYQNPQAPNKDIQTIASSFRFKNNSLVPYEGTCMISSTTIRNNKVYRMDIEFGQFNSGYAEGLFLCKEFTDTIRIRRDKYKDGAIKNPIRILEVFPRFVMLYIIVWYLIKYIYGTILLITPLYYHIRKKNWKI